MATEMSTIAPLDIQPESGPAERAGSTLTLPRTALFLAQCSGEAYASKSDLELLYRSNSRWTFEPKYFITNRGTDDPDHGAEAFIIYNATRKLVVLSFRGTEITGSFSDSFVDAFKDVIVDLAAMETMPYYGDPYACVAVGFMTQWTSIKQKVIDSLDAISAQLGPCAVYVTGHSLGGALATLAVLDVYALADWTTLDVYTYGAPVVGNRAFADQYKRHVTGWGEGRTFGSYQVIGSRNDWVAGIANALLTRGDDAFERVVDQFDAPGVRAHGILNYINALSDEDDDAAAAPAASVTTTARRGAPVLTVRPTRSEQDAPTAVNQPLEALALRVFTSPESDLPQGFRVSFGSRLAPNGTGGDVSSLDGTDAFGPAQANVFEPAIKRGSVIQDFYRCKFTWQPVDPEAGATPWQLAALEVRINGQLLSTTADMAYAFDEDNSEVLFCPVHPDEVAYRVRWSGAPEYDLMTDSANTPSVAVAADATVVVAYQDSNKRVVCRIGRINGAQIAWSDPAQVVDKAGRDPSIAINEDNVVVEVHRGADSEHLFYRVAQLVDGAIAWPEQSESFGEKGNPPAVSMRGAYAVAVHRSEDHTKLYYRVGRVGPGPTIQWADKSTLYEPSGSDPTVALATNLRVVEVHKSPDNDHLYYRTGQIDEATLLIRWDSEDGIRFDTGEQSGIAVDAHGRIIEVHQGDEGNTRVYYRAASIWRDLALSWGAEAQSYNVDGFSPRVGVNDAGVVVTLFRSSGNHAVQYRVGAWDPETFDQ